MNFNSMSGSEGDPTTETDGALPIGAGDGDDTSFDPLASASDTRRSHSGAIVIGIVIVAAVAGLYSMRMLSRLTAAPGIDSSAVSTIDEFFKSGADRRIGDAGGSVFSDNGSVLTVLQDDFTGQQVSPDNVQRDPFVIYHARPIEPDDPEPVVTAPTSTPEEIDLATRADIQRAGDRLTLKSVVGGSTPLAIIDGEIVRIGDILTVSGSPYEFEITRITPSAVELEVRHADLLGQAEIVNLIVHR